MTEVELDELCERDDVFGLDVCCEISYFIANKAITYYNEPTIENYTDLVMTMGKYSLNRYYKKSGDALLTVLRIVHKLQEQDGTRIIF